MFDFFEQINKSLKMIIVRTRLQGCASTKFNMFGLQAAMVAVSHATGRGQALRRDM